MIVYSNILLLRFPQTESKKPIICYLAKDFDLEFTILDATIYPRQEGRMVMELFGSRENFDKGLKFLKEQGVIVERAAQEVGRDEDKCVQCGACLAVCPTNALYIVRPEMRVDFDSSKCSMCELCVTTCPSRAMMVDIKKDRPLFHEK